MTICIARQKVKTMPQIHIQFRFFGVGIINVSYKRPMIGRRELIAFVALDFGS